MAAGTSSPQSPSFSHQTHSPTSQSHASSPTALNTNQTAKRTPLQRPPSYARNRMSAYSNTSRLSGRASRPTSHVFPAFHSSLPYALVRDFAYPVSHPCHYGPPPVSSEPASGNSTPASERQRRLSDPANGGWEIVGAWGGDGFISTQQLPQMAYGDGPPYSEDEDLHSPIVKSSRHKKHKSAFPDSEIQRRRGRRRSPRGTEYEDFDSDIGQHGFRTSINEDGTETYYVGDEDETAGGPGGELVTYPPDQVPSSILAPNRFGQGDSQFVGGSRNRNHTQGVLEDLEEDSLDVPDRDDSRYSRDYQFTIASPDEEMHGKAVALFDFSRENENELPLTEGQVIWVSYRHGQGWLVAEDPKTGDAGLVPEEYVRLLRDIEGGLGSLGAEPEEAELEDISPNSPTNEDPPSPTKIEAPKTHSSHHSNGSNNVEKNPAVVSSFSTSSKDLDPYPHPLHGAQASHIPPQIVHYGSQTNTPTLRSPTGGGAGPRNFEEIKGELQERGEEDREARAGR